MGLSSSGRGVLGGDDFEDLTDGEMLDGVNIIVCCRRFGGLDQFQGDGAQKAVLFLFLEAVRSSLT